MGKWKGEFDRPSDNKKRMQRKKRYKMVCANINCKIIPYKYKQIFL